MLHCKESNAVYRRFSSSSYGRISKFYILVFFYFTSLQVAAEQLHYQVLSEESLRLEIRLYTPNISNNFPKTSKTFHPPLLKNFHSIPQPMSSKFSTREENKYPKKDVVKNQKEILKIT